MMIKVKLQTTRGEHVADVEIPPFNARPDVIGWGERVFTRYADVPGDMLAEAYLVYRECFSYAVPVEQQATEASSMITSLAPKSEITLRLLDNGKVLIQRHRRGAEYDTATGFDPDDKDAAAILALLKHIDMEF